jgi:hypothetical protein
MRVSNLKITAANPRDLAFGDIGGEARINVVQPRECRLNRVLVHASLWYCNARNGPHQLARRAR